MEKTYDINVSEEDSLIRLQLSDWLYNAGVIGFLNILESEGDSYEAEGQEILFDKSVLDNFEEKYFNYFIKTYGKNLSWNKIVIFEKFIKKHEEEEFRNFDEKALEVLNNYIGTSAKSGTLKYFLSSNSYKAAYELIQNDFDILKAEKELKQIKMKKNENIFDKISEIKEIFLKIKEIIRYCGSKSGRKYLAGKNVIYTIIKNAWSGVSFLNAQTKVKDTYKDYKNYFLDKTKEYIEQDNSKNKYNCFSCDNKIKNLNDDLSFLNMTGFDTNRKPSHVWNFSNDTAICPICKLIYSCVPAGFVYVYDKGVFINENHNIENALRINNKVKRDILNNSESNGNFNTFSALINAFQESINNNTKYELADIQVVRYEEEKYRFNFLSKNILKVLNESKSELNSIIKIGFKEIKTYFKIYEEVIEKLLNNQNLFLLVHKLMILKISKPRDSHYHIGHINNIMKININFLKGVGHMGNIEKDILKSASGAGYYLKKAYKDKNSENKLDGISYRLLNALKTNNRGMFMDTLLNCYLYTDKTVPQFFIDCLRDEMVFKTIGYAFVTGLIEGKSESNSNGGDN